MSCLLLLLVLVVWFLCGFTLRRPLGGSNGPLSRGLRRVLLLLLGRGLGGRDAPAALAAAAHHRVLVGAISAIGDPVAGGVPVHAPAVLAFVRVLRTTRTSPLGPILPIGKVSQWLQYAK